MASLTVHIILRGLLDISTSDLYSALLSCRMLPGIKERKFHNDRRESYYIWHHDIVSVVSFRIREMSHTKNLFDRYVSRPGEIVCWPNVIDLKVV